MIKIKRGDTFKRTVSLKDSQEVAIIPDEIAAQVRNDKDHLIEELSVFAGEDAGEFILYSVDTSNYPIGILRLEMRFVIAGEKYSAKTLELVVERGYKDE